MNIFEDHMEQFLNLPHAIDEDKILSDVMNVIPDKFDNKAIAKIKKRKDYNYLLHKIFFLICNNLISNKLLINGIFFMLKLLMLNDSNNDNNNDNNKKLTEILKSLNSYLNPNKLPYSTRPDLLIFQKNKLSPEQLLDIVNDHIAKLDKAFPTVSCVSQDKIHTIFNTDFHWEKDSLLALQYKILLLCITKYPESIYINKEQSLIFNRIFLCICACYFFYQLEKTCNVSWEYRYYFAGIASQQYANYNISASDDTKENATKLLNKFQNSIFYPNFTRIPNKKTLNDYNNLLLFRLKLKAIREGLLFTTCPILLKFAHDMKSSNSIQKIFNLSIPEIIQLHYFKCKNMNITNFCNFITQNKDPELRIFNYPSLFNNNLPIYTCPTKAKGTHFKKKEFEFNQSTVSKCVKDDSKSKTKSVINYKKFKGIAESDEYKIPITNMLNPQPKISEFNIKVPCDFEKKVILPDNGKVLSTDYLTYVLGLSSQSSIGSIRNKFSQKINALMNPKSSIKTPKNDIIIALQQRWKNRKEFLNYDEKIDVYNPDIPPDATGIFVSFYLHHRIIDDYIRFLKNNRGITNVLKKLKEKGAREFDRKYLKIFTETIKKCSKKNTDTIFSSYIWFRVPLQNILYLLGETYNAHEKYPGLYLLAQDTCSSFSKPISYPEYGTKSYRFIPEKVKDEDGNLIEY